MAAATPAGNDSAPSARTLVIIPTYNERDNIGLIVGRLHAALPHTHVLIVDDGSPDGTGDVADRLAAASEGRIHVMHRTEKNGLGAAYIAGFRWGLERGYTVLVEMDLARHSAGGASLGRTVATTIRNTVIHPVVLPVLCGFAWHLTGIPLPTVLDEVLQMLGSAVVPLCLVLIGMSLAYYGLPRGAIRLHRR